MHDPYLFLAIAVATICTFAVRWLPFALFGKHRKVPNFITGLGRVLPAAVMATLLVYCIRNIGTESVTQWAGTAFAVFATVCVHVWKRHVLFSIAIGTIVYMVALQFGFS